MTDDPLSSREPLMTQKQIHRPQRLTPPAPPGAPLKRLHGIAALIKVREVTGNDAAYLDMIRQCLCLHCGMDPCGEAAHVRFSSGTHNKRGGMGAKPADRWAVPLCGEHHRLADDAQHNIGERRFWAQLGINPLLVAEKLYAKRGDVVAMRAVCFNAIAERESVTPMG